ncbi:MAG: IS256 family transposase [Geobacteraceae bacterium]|nr:IS256 family transposase [Geobacteraceae bacterium]
MEVSKPQIIQINEGEVHAHVDRLVKQTVEEMLNGMLDAEADRLCQARRYEHSDQRQDTRAGHYKRKLHVKAGEVELKVPKLRHLPFETAIIERYRRREASVEEALIEMYLAGVSVRRVEDITEALWGTRVSPGTVSNLNKKTYERINEWRNQPIEGRHRYIYLDGIWLKRSWCGEVRNLSILVCIGVGDGGFREVLGVVEGAKEDKESWLSFMRHLKSRGLREVKLAVSDKCLGLVEALGEVYPEARWQRCVVHFYRNVFTVVPRGKIKAVAAMLKAIHAQEDRPAAEEKIQAVAAKLEQMKLAKAATMVREGAQETLSYYNFPQAHWRHLRTNNPLERIMREIRRRTRVVGSFPDGESALMLVAARLRYVEGTRWGTRRYMSMERFNDVMEEEVSTTA